MSGVTELLAQLPARCRFVPSHAETVAVEQAVAKGWTVQQIADVIIAGVGTTAHSPSGLAVSILKSAAGTPPPAADRNRSNAGQPPARGKPECANCGQPYGRRNVRPQLGDYDQDCVDCGEPLTLVDPPRVVGL